MKRIAIIGGGVVGMTAAFYLSKAKDCQVTLFDDGKQATKAAVGIICPWLNQRRNKFWYGLVQDGAEFYDTLIKDLDDDSFYQQVGALYINPKMEDKIFELASRRANDSYKVGKVRKVNKLANPELTPHDFKWESGIHVSGAARVDGQLLLKSLLKRNISQGVDYIHKKVLVEKIGDQYRVNQEFFDLLVLTPGPHLKEVMSFYQEYQVDVRAQKGQLIHFNMQDEQAYPVIMPKGELDFLFGKDGNLVVGASHENNFSNDQVDMDVLKALKLEAVDYLPSLRDKAIAGHRLGFRAQNSSFTPFYGNLKDDPSIYVASALGSSGLNSGPIMGYRLAQDIVDPSIEGKAYFNANDYVVKK